MPKCHSHINTSETAVMNITQSEKVTQHNTPYCCRCVLCANWVSLALRLYALCPTLSMFFGLGALCFMLHVRCYRTTLQPPRLLYGLRGCVLCATWLASC